MTKNTALLIILLFFLGVVIVLFLSIALRQAPTDFETQAAFSPQEVIVSNLSSSNATISWYTPDELEGYVRYGTQPGQFTTTINDFRDEDTPAKRKLHYVKLINLLPERTYYFTLVAGEETFNEPADKFSFKTLPVADAISVPNALLISAPSSFEEGVVYMHANKNNTASTTASIYATSPNITLEKSLLKNIDGTVYDVTGSTLVLSLTADDGDRARSSISGAATEATIGVLDSGTTAYTPGVIVSTGGTSDNTAGLTRENPILLANCTQTCKNASFCQCPSGCQTDPGTYQATSDVWSCGGNKVTAANPPPVTPPTPTPPVTPPVVPPTPPPVTPSPLPSTAIEDDIAAAFQMLLATVCIILGIAFWLEKKRML